MAGIIWTILSLMVAFWVVGLLLHIGGGLIHLLLVGALILFVFNMITGRKATAV